MPKVTSFSFIESLLLKVAGHQRLLLTMILVKCTIINFQCLVDLCTVLVLISFVVAAVGDAKSYIIISQLPADVYKKFVEDRSSSHMMGLTFVVVGIIHLGGGKVTEGILASWINFV